MAEYKYRALGWKDDDIASLNVVDGTAADNQVELQITKQGAGTIDGPAIVGKDGITINKAADSEKIEISGSGYVKQATSTKNALVYARVLGEEVTRTLSYIPGRDVIPIYNKEATLRGNMGANPTEDTLTNKKYVDDNYVKKDTSAANQQVYGHDVNGDPQMFYVTTGNSNPYWLCKYQDSTSGATEPTGNGRLITQDPTQPYQAANKHYVDETDKNLRLKLSNLEQTLNGYILDTTKEAYADLDSAVLKDSVALGDNVYPIADKTRALVTRIEGKTTKMVQLLDKSKFPATSTPIAGVTVTKTDDGGLHVLGTAANSGGRNSWGITVNVEKGHKYLSLLKGNNKITSPIVTLKSDTSQYVGFVADIVTSTIEGECKYGFNLAAEDYDETIYPQLFDLTAMNREDITTAEQFKAEFPDFYPYENGNIYPAKISGVKFTGKNLKNIPNGIGSKDYAANELPKNIPLVLSARLSLKEGNARVRASWIKNGTREYVYGNTITASTGISKAVFMIPLSATNTRIALQTFGDDVGFEYSNVQIEAGTAPTAYEPYTEPVSVTLPETYDLHGVGDYKDYLEITKNENNELYTLKKVQVIDKRVFDGTEAWSENMVVENHYQVDVNGMLFGHDINPIISSHYPTNKTPSSYYSDLNYAIMAVDGDRIRIKDVSFAETGLDGFKAYLAAQFTAGTPVTAYYALATPVETVIATNLTYEQVTAIRHNGGLIEVEGNTNKGYARPTVTNTIVYRLTASTTVDGTSIVKDTDGKIQLNQEYIDYLDNQLYQPPAISVFTMLDAAGAALPTSNELGTTLSAASFNHQETNIKNIQGDNVELHINNAVAATTSTAKKDVATKVTLTTAQSITSSTKFTLKGTNTKGAAFSRDYQVNFYRYAYTATTDATTAPTSGATQQAAVSTFASNGSTFNYTKGAYIYFYTDNTGKKVQTNVLGQWADVDTTDMGKVTLTQSNGATHEYTCYRIGPFIETGSAKYRV